jgi:hypothetical protein
MVDAGLYLMKRLVRHFFNHLGGKLIKHKHPPPICILTDRNFRLLLLTDQDYTVG